MNPTIIRYEGRGKGGVEITPPPLHAPRMRMRLKKTTPLKICFASHNENKIREIREMLPEGHLLVGLSDLQVREEIPETGKTLSENSRIKAKYVYDRFKMPVFADDSGLLVDALNGEPGVYSARYAGKEKNADNNIDLLLERMKNKKDRSARFETIITYFDARGEEFQFRGTVEGELLNEKKGVNGFGYDPIFKPKEHAFSFAELSSQIKNKISHRAIAMSKFLAHLTGLPS